MTKPIILVKICYNIVKELQIFDKVISWPQLISNLITPVYKPDYTCL